MRSNKTAQPIESRILGRIHGLGKGSVFTPTRFLDVGSRLAAKARKQASKLTAEQRREHFNQAMVMIYGGANEKAVARH